MRYYELFEADRPLKILVIVHPGSACGSADFNLGADDADQARGLLINDINQWPNGVIVIDGGLSSELTGPRYHGLGQAINELVSRAKSHGYIAVRRMGDDPAQARVIRQIAEKLKLQPENVQFTLTGAWIHSSDGGGCVNDVGGVLKNMGFTVTVLPSTFDLDLE